MNPIRARNVTPAANAQTRLVSIVEGDKGSDRPNEW